MSQAVLGRDVPEAGAAAATRPRRSLLRPALMLGGIVLVVAGSLGWWISGGRTVSIDNAYVRADKLAVSTDVAGLVAAVPVREGQAVKRGDVLFQLDPRQFGIALDSAKANLNATALTLEAAKRDYERMLRDVAGRNAQVAMDQARFDRANGLVGRGDVSRQVFDDARYQLQVNQQAVESSRAAAAAQLARLGGDANAEVTAMPAYKQAATMVDEAQRQLDHATVRAPMDGIVTGVSALQPGMYLAAGTPAFGLVSSESVWVEANPKETELTWVRPGNPVHVTVDTYPGRVWDGSVESIAPASGSEFAILPAQNSSGNWVKVVQRIPIRIRVERRADEPPLRAGMSVEAEVDTGHVRTWSELF